MKHNLLLRAAMGSTAMAIAKMFIASMAIATMTSGCGQRYNIQQAEKAATVQCLKKNVTTLADDNMAGRKPFTEGAQKAVEYIAGQMKEIGLTPYSGDSYFQDFEIVMSKTECSKNMILQTPKGKISLERYRDFTAFSKRFEEKITIENSPLFFAGYGIVAPEYGKDDYAGIENKEDKIAVVIVNDPGLGSDDTGYFKGNEMTFYGRWTYKFIEGAKHGVKGVLIIHDDLGAGYPWSVVNASASSKLYLADRPEGEYYCALEGWISNDAAQKLFESNGYELDKLVVEARKPDFKAFDLKSTATVSMKNSFSRDKTPNVVGYIKGSEPTEESIVYCGHWDHLGIGKPIDGDSIINGASDNAVAVAWALEIAKCYKALNKNPRRNVVFLIPSCEEAGLLGSTYYAENPLFPISEMAAVINFDVYPLWGKNKDVTITGFGHSSLDSLLSVVAKRHGRYIMADPESSNGMFYRSDHFPFAIKGVPAMFAKGWNDSEEHGKEWSAEKIRDYWAHIYHKPTDQCHPDDNYSGLLQEVNLFFEFGYEIAGSTNFPKWNETSEFRNIR